VRRTTLACAALVVVVLVTLCVAEVWPRMELRDVAGPSGVVHLPSWLPGDCPFYRAATTALLHGRLDLRGDPLFGVLPAPGQVALGTHGEWYPKHPLLLSALAVPFYAALGDRGLLLFNLLQVTALDVLILLLARRAASDGIALAVALWFALGSLLRLVALNVSPDVLSTLVVLGAVLALLSRRAVLAGALLGLSVWAKWTNLFFLGPALVYGAFALGPRAALRMVAGAGPPLLALAGLNWHMFGSPLVTPYDRVLSGAGGIEPSHRQLFDQPVLAGLWRQLTDHQMGLVASAPQVILALPGLVALFVSTRDEALLIAALCAVQLAVFAPYREWAASSYGSRFLLTVVVLSALPVAALAQWVLAPLGDAETRS
jgi:hypothetical protein